MKSFTSRRFRKMYANVPEDIQVRGRHVRNGRTARRPIAGSHRVASIRHPHRYDLVAMAAIDQKVGIQCQDFR